MTTTTKAPPVWALRAARALKNEWPIGYMSGHLTPELIEPPDAELAEIISRESPCTEILEALETLATWKVDDEPFALRASIRRMKSLAEAALRKGREEL